MAERLLCQCIDGDPACGEYYDCIDLMRRVRPHCGDRSQECMQAADNKGATQRKTMFERKIEMLAEIERTTIRPRVIEEPTPAAALSVQPSLAAQMAGAVPKEPPVHRPPPCLGGGGCDKRPIRYIREGIRGPVCDAIGAPVNQLPGNECPIERQDRLEKERHRI